MNKWLPWLVSILVLAASAPSIGEVAAEAAFRQGMTAVQSNDFASGLHYLELAITDDPDNLRYASEYRQAIIRRKEFDRSIEFFEKLLISNPSSANLHLNYGFAYVDKIPVVGSITQVILANTASASLPRLWISSRLGSLSTREARATCFGPESSEKPRLEWPTSNGPLLFNKRAQRSLISHACTLPSATVTARWTYLIRLVPLGRKAYVSFPITWNSKTAFRCRWMTYLSTSRMASIPTSAWTQT